MATTLEVVRIIIILSLSIINIRSLVVALRDQWDSENLLKWYKIESSSSKSLRIQEAILMVANRNVTRDVWRCVKQFILLGLSYVSLHSTPSPETWITLYSPLALVIISAIISFESWQEMKDREMIKQKRLGLHADNL